MSSKVLGHIRGLGHAEMKAIEKLSERRLSTDEIVSLQLARELYEISEKISRKVALLISREGRVEYLVVGTKEIFYLPDLGRYRLGTGRLRQLRLVYPDLSKKHPEPVISQDVYTDLEKLRLDAVIAVKQVGNRLAATYA